MKKVFIIALLAFFGMTQAQVTFKPGLRGGVNFSHFTKGDDYSYYDGSNYVTESNRFESKTDFYLGFYGALHLTKYYTLQPEIDYSRQGSTFKGSNSVPDQDLDVSYLSIAIANKFTFGEKFNVHLGPTLEFVVDESGFNADNEIDFAFFLGAGYNITKNFGIEARVKKGIIPVVDDYNNSYGDSYHTNVVFSVGATYTFDLK